MEHFSDLLTRQIKAQTGNEGDLHKDFRDIIDIPVEQRRGKLGILVCFTPAIEPGATKLVRIEIVRAHLWDALRRTGKDTGSYTLGPTKPKELKISIMGPPKFSPADISLLPTDPVNDEDQRKAADSGTWSADMGLVSAGTTCNYRVVWQNHPSFVERWYRSLQISLGKTET
jgi:hypothetical protein